MTELAPGANAPLPVGDLTVLIRHGAIPGAAIDVSAFLAAFSTNQPAADFTHDGIFNFFDVSAFLSLFSAGCE